MIQTRNNLDELLPQKMYCSKKDMIKALIKSGLCGSIPNAYKVIKDLPWIQVGEGNRSVILTDTAIKFFTDRM